ncbi:MAG TPA: hypothetical protein VFC16_10770 [Nakamurella sp.]|nr:hypothetical protein [Nakamurella sp.]
MIPLRSTPKDGSALMVKTVDTSARSGGAIAWTVSHGPAIQDRSSYAAITCSAVARPSRTPARSIRCRNESSTT